MLNTQVGFLCEASPLEEEMATHSSILARIIHGLRRLEGYSPWGHEESEVTEHACTCERERFDLNRP